MSGSGSWEGRGPSTSRAPLLGMDEEVHSDEDARKLMLQLHTVEKLVDMTLDLKINTIRNIQPQPQILHRVEPPANPTSRSIPS